LACAARPACYVKSASGGGLKLLAKPYSVLMSSASAGGTIAAVRCLGAKGYDVGVLYNSPLSAAAWSRFTARAYRSPPEKHSAPFLQRLMQIGAKRPGQLLLGSSDETAWLYSENAKMLSEHFVLYQPSVESMRRILDKSELAAAGQKVGIATPPTWAPADRRELDELSLTLPFPVLIKPRTHVQRVHNDKGVVVHSRAELLREVAAFAERENHHDRQDEMDRQRPLLQRFLRGGSGAVSITGFIDRTGEHFVTRTCVKVFQRLNEIGVGLCFEARRPDDDLSEATRRLCRELGYFGVFEAEFLCMDGGWALIDFNPRLFNQVGLDIHREMPLPLLACLDAFGDHHGLRETVGRALAYDQSQPAIIQDGFTIRAVLLAQTFAGASGRAQRSDWKSYMNKHASHAVDFAADRRDRLPALVHAASETLHGLRAIPRFLRASARSSASMRPEAAETAT